MVDLKPAYEGVTIISSVTFLCCECGAWERQNLARERERQCSLLHSSQTERCNRVYLQLHPPRNESQCTRQHLETIRTPNLRHRAIPSFRPICEPIQMSLHVLSTATLNILVRKSGAPGGVPATASGNSISAYGCEASAPTATGCTDLLPFPQLYKLRVVLSVEDVFLPDHDHPLALSMMSLPTAEQYDGLNGTTRGILRDYHELSALKASVLERPQDGLAVDTVELDIALAERERTYRAEVKSLLTTEVDEKGDDADVNMQDDDGFDEPGELEDPAGHTSVEELPVPLPTLEQYDIQSESTRSALLKYQQLLALKDLALTYEKPQAQVALGWCVTLAKVDAMLTERWMAYETEVGKLLNPQLPNNQSPGNGPMATQASEEPDEADGLKMLAARAGTNDVVDPESHNDGKAVSASPSFVRGVEEATDQYLKYSPAPSRDSTPAFVRRAYVPPPAPAYKAYRRTWYSRATGRGELRRLEREEADAEDAELIHEYLRNHPNPYWRGRGVNWMQFSRENPKRNNKGWATWWYHKKGLVRELQELQSEMSE